MKPKIFLPFLALLFICCANKVQMDENDSDFENGYYTRVESSQGATGLRPRGMALDNGPKQDAKKIHQLRDPRSGLVVSSSLHPANWKVISRAIYTMDQKIPTFLIQTAGPHNLMAFNTPTTFHIEYQNPQTAQYMAQMGLGKMIRPMVYNETLFREEVYPRMKKSGFTLAGDLPMPEYESLLRDTMREMGFGNANMEYSATQWTNEKGQKAMARIIKTSLGQPSAYNDGFRVWYYSVDYIFVDEEFFEPTLNRFLEVAASREENPQWAQYMAHLKQQRAWESQKKMQQSAQQHQNRMANQQAAFNAHQEKMKGIYAAQDANHAAFMNRNFGPGSDMAHNRLINTIHEEETVYNPQTGRNYQVNAGSMEYWMDSDGNYIENNDTFYNPNGDINLNNREWTKVKKAF